MRTTNKEELTRIGAAIHTKDDEALRKLAFKLKKTKSQLVKEIIHEYVSKNGNASSSPVPAKPDAEQDNKQEQDGPYAHLLDDI